MKHKKKINSLEVYKQLRKQIPPPSKVFIDKKATYNRKDKSWKKDI